jgi:hypothetical protein
MVGANKATNKDVRTGGKYCKKKFINFHPILPAVDFDM